MYASGSVPDWEERSKEDCIAKAKELKESDRVAKAAADAGSKDVAFKLYKSQKQNGSSENPADASTEWSDSQQKQLEEALRTFPSSMDKNERWKCIAKAVNGKTKKDCVVRFKALRAALLKKKKSAAGK